MQALRGFERNAASQSLIEKLRWDRCKRCNVSILSGQYDVYQDVERYLFQLKLIEIYAIDSTVGTSLSAGASPL